MGIQTTLKTDAENNLLIWRKETMKSLRMFLVLLLCLSLFAGLVPAAWAEEMAEGNSIPEKLQTVLAEYPDGSLWTSSFDGGSQCYGFAKLVVFKLFGKYSSSQYRSWNYNGYSTSGMNKVAAVENCTSTNVKELLQKAMPGDVLQFDTGNTSGHQHSMIVYSITNNGAEIYECNWTKNTVTKTSLTYTQIANRQTRKDGTKRGTLSLLHSDNYPTVDSSVQQCLDQCTSYQCNYTLTVKVEGRMKNMPASVVDNPQSETVEELTMGHTYYSSTYWVNPLGETWYETTSTTGQRGFIYYGDVDLSQPISTLSVSGYEGNPGTPTGTLTLGSNFGLRGIISSNYIITHVDAHIYDSDNRDAQNTTAYHTDWNSKSYNIQTDGINNHFSFRLLKNGSYRYVVSAQDSSGTSKTLINSQFTVGSGATEQKSVFDLNGWLDGNLSWGNIEGYGTVDVYINGSLTASNVSDYCAEYPVGTSYEIKNIRALDGHQYDGIHSGSLVGTIGTERVEVYLAFSKLSYLNLDGLLDGMANDGLGAYGVVDVYINGNLVAEGWTDYWEAWPAGTTYEIKNIRANEGYQYNGVHSGSLSGTIGTERVNVVLSFSSLVNLNLDGFLDGSKYDSLNDYGTADVYINGSMVASGCSDYWEAWPAGTAYEIKNIRANTGYRYDGVYSGSLSGMIETERIDVVLAFSTATYIIKYDANCGTGAPRNQTKTHGEIIILSTIIPTRPGYTFLGWAESADATAAMYQPGDSFTKDADTTLYAVWSNLEPDFILPAALTEIDEEAFAGGAFESVQIPAGVTSIAPDAFGERSDLVIFGVRGTYAETYAGLKGFTFIPVG